MGKGVLRNRPCPCGSNLKYKKCHLPQEQGFAKVELTPGHFVWEKAARVHNPVSYILPSFGGGK